MSLDPETIRTELTRLAEITAGLVDGEDVKAIITDGAMYHIQNPDAKHRFLSMDHYDVDHATFLRVKKLLMRIERLTDVVWNASVWLRLPGTDEVTAALLNGAHHRYYKFGQQQRAMPDEMRRAFETGQVTPAPSGPDDRQVTVLAPVRDSLQDVVAVVELTAPLAPRAPAFV